jgi:hypothetical protein
LRTTGQGKQKSALVIGIAASKKGTISGMRKPDLSILEASCRETIDGPAVEYEGENDEWVKLVDRSKQAITDNMPLIDPLTPPREYYVNSTYVIGEQVLPVCDLRA